MPPLRRRTAVLLGLASLAILPALAQNTQEPQASAPAELPAVRVLPTGGLKVESAALLVSGEQGGSIQVAVLPLFVPGIPGRVRVPVVLEIDGATLLKGNSGDLLRIEICLYAVAANGSVQGSLLETIEADLSRVGAAVERSGIQYAGELSLPPGEQSLRALVRNGLTGEVGLRILPLTVPDPAKGPLLLAPAFSNPAPGAWVAALTKSALASPVALADGGLPAAQPVLGIGQEARCELPVWKLRAPDGLRIEVLRPDGGHVAELPARIEARREAAGLERLTVSFTPAGLEPSRYLLRAAVPGTEAPAWSSLVVVLAGGGEGKVWAELLHGGRSPTRSAAAGRPEPARPAPRRLDARPVRAAYRGALELLASGDEPAARRAVAALEAGLLAGPKAAASSAEVAEIEIAQAQELAAAAPQSLLPVAVLHEALYREALDRRDAPLAAHAREVVFALAGLFAHHGGDAGPRTAARLLLSLAARLVQSAPLGLAERTFSQVLTFDADNETAHLYLAVIAEREGRYPEAVVQLEKLLRSHPDNAEARVHLAVNLRRLGKPHDADRLLAGLLQGPSATAEPWVLALAYHETARALLAAGRLDDAERTLRDGLKRLPGDEKLLLQLAAVADLRHDPAQARQLLAAFKPGRGGSGSARHRYTQLAATALEDAWTGLLRSAPERLPALAAALKVPGPHHPPPPPPSPPPRVPPPPAPSGRGAPPPENQEEEKEEPVTQILAGVPPLPFGLGVWGHARERGSGGEGGPEASTAAMDRSRR
jgi:tetratricopeptide (TPR) repeat protein